MWRHHGVGCLRLVAWCCWLIVCVAWKPLRGPSRLGLRMTATMIPQRPYTAIMIVPTGIGAKIGGFAGDALPSAKLLASVTDVLVTHPNVMNGAMMYWPKDNILYVEGHSLNRFARGELMLQPLTKQGHRIGVIFDKAMEPELRLRHLQVIDAARATLGIDVAHVAVTNVPLKISNRFSDESGASWGSVDETRALIDAAEYLIHQKHCTAIAIVGRFPEDEELDAALALEGAAQGPSAEERFAAYRAGEGVDGIAGVEAILSHLVSHRCHVPCAHAPAFLPAALDGDVSPKACAEEIGYTFLPCVLAYLHRAPRLIPIRETTSSTVVGTSSWNGGGGGGLLHRDDVDAVVVPANALGGPAVLTLLDRFRRGGGGGGRRGLIIAVADNPTTMAVTPEALSGGGTTSMEDVDEAVIVTVQSYLEAAGVLAAHKAGLFRPSLSPQVPSVPMTEL